MKYLTSTCGKKMLVKDTKRYGVGVFAVDAINKKESVYLLKGKRLFLREVVARINSGVEYKDDPLQVGRKTYIDLEEGSRNFNHSCDPNTLVRKRSELIAIRDIKPGEEITYDYSATIAPTDWIMNCKCGSSRCRKVLKDVRSIPSRIIEEYRDAGGIQRYMRSILDGIKLQGKYIMPKYEILALKRLKEGGKYY